MSELQWIQDVREWAEGKATPKLTEDFIKFFRHAFKTPSQLYSQDAWFGALKSRASLTRGNIWLAALGLNPKRVDLLVDEDPHIAGFQFVRAPSTQNYMPLGWIIIEPWDDVTTLIQRRSVWDSYARACEKILYSTPVATPRPDHYYTRWGKRKLSEILASNETTRTRPPDESQADGRRRTSVPTYFAEGGVREITIELRQRNSRLRGQAIEKYGYQCQVCGFDFGAFYGDIGVDYIEVHHLSPLSDRGTPRKSTIDDVRVVCANCHRILHHNGRNPLTLDELRDVIKRQRLHD